MEEELSKEDIKEPQKVPAETEAPKDHSETKKVQEKKEVDEEKPVLEEKKPAPEEKKPTQEEKKPAQEAPKKAAHPKVEKHHTGTTKTHSHAPRKRHQPFLSTPLISMIVLVVVLMAFNEFQIISLTGAVAGGEKTKTYSASEKLQNVNFAEIKSTGHAVAAVFPVEDIIDTQSAIDVIIPTGDPVYAEQLGISYDDPVTGLDKLVPLEKAVQLEGEEQARYINLVSNPYGISCEFCCGVGPAGASKDGRSKCGCKHNPAVLGLTKWLIQNTEWTDAEILYEVLRWKSLFFPKNMVELGLKVAGGDTSSLAELPGMVGGC